MPINAKFPSSNLIFAGKKQGITPAVSFSEGKMQYAQPFLPYQRITLIASRIMAAVMARMQA